MVSSGATEGRTRLTTFTKLAWPKPDKYLGEVDVSKDISCPESLASCRRRYDGEASGGAKLNRTITKIESHFLSPRKFLLQHWRHPTRYNGEAEGVKGTVGGVLKRSKLPAGDNRPQCRTGMRSLGANVKGSKRHKDLIRKEGVTHPRIRAFEQKEILKKEETQIYEKQLPKEKYLEEAEPFSLSKRDVAPEAGSEWKEELVKAPKENWPPEKEIVDDDYPDQPITIGGSLSAECRTELTKNTS
ncbi:hypothetical protein Tco_0460981 [Tanacetum coccineum]